MVDDPAAMIVRQTDGRGVDAAIDAVGFEAQGSLPETVLTSLKIEGSSGAAIRQAIAVARRGGVVSVPGFSSATSSKRGLQFARARRT